MSTKTRLGAVSAGHAETVTAAHAMLAAGGNAFDAALAAYLAACVAEPILASLGGGGFLLAHRSGERTLLYDFFVHSPRHPREEGVDFYPVDVDFGATTQEFHIGMGSIATPGGVRGLFRVHKDLCSLPLLEIAQPALALARNGVRVNALQSYLQGILEPILVATDEARTLFSAANAPDRLAREGDQFRMPDFANFLETLIEEGDVLFYSGDVAKAIAEANAERGGHLDMSDLENYEVIVREPLRLRHRGADLSMNPPPSSGGVLIAFALALLEQAGDIDAFGSIEHVRRLIETMYLTDRARHDSGLDQSDEAPDRLLSDAFLNEYLRLRTEHPLFPRGTTHISVADDAGNLASLSLSNGEGSAFVAPGTGVMLNNMLGEEDLNPAGLQKFPPDRRMASMMCPTLMTREDGTAVALGSGGSNRLRTAILQVLVDTLYFDMNLEASVNSPRLHFERDVLNVEPGFPPATTDWFRDSFPDAVFWDAFNLFFGGVHAVAVHPDGTFSAGADARRGGVARTT
ncbi:MAG: gamma-glutamyltransferase [Gammaproteobacteria bacterium]|nr:MAG: gamma-glutamyltransferase [Gammaproteobacteria bacterium]